MKEIYVSTVSVDADCIEFTETLAALIEMYSDMTQRMKERCDMLEERNTDTGFRCHVRNVGGRGAAFCCVKKSSPGIKGFGIFLDENINNDWRVQNNFASEEARIRAQ